MIDLLNKPFKVIGIYSQDFKFDNFVDSKKSVGSEIAGPVAEGTISGFQPNIGRYTAPKNPVMNWVNRRVIKTSWVRVKPSTFKKVVDNYSNQRNVINQAEKSPPEFFGSESFSYVSNLVTVLDGGTGAFSKTLKFLNKIVKTTKQKLFINGLINNPDLSFFEEHDLSEERTLYLSEEDRSSLAVGDKIKDLNKIVFVFYSKLKLNYAFTFANYSFGRSGSLTLRNVCLCVEKDSTTKEGYQLYFLTNQKITENDLFNQFPGEPSFPVEVKKGLFRFDGQKTESDCMEKFFSAKWYEEVKKKKFFSFRKVFPFFLLEGRDRSELYVFSLSVEEEKPEPEAPGTPVGVDIQYPQSNPLKPPMNVPGDNANSAESNQPSDQKPEDIDYFQDVLNNLPWVIILFLPLLLGVLFAVFAKFGGFLLEFLGSGVLHGKDDAFKSNDSTEEQQIASGKYEAKTSDTQVETPDERLPEVEPGLEKEKPPIFEQNDKDKAFLKNFFNKKLRQKRIQNSQSEKRIQNSQSEKLSQNSQSEKLSQNSQSENVNDTIDEETIKSEYQEDTFDEKDN